MSITEKLIDELKKKPELIEKLYELLSPYIERSEILKQIYNLRDSLKAMLSITTSMIQSQTTILEEIRAIKEDIRELRAEQVKIWQEIKAIKEDIRELRAEQVKIWQEIKAIKEDIRELRAEQVKIWQEIKAIKEDIRDLREDFNEMLSRIIALERGHMRLEESFERLRSDILTGFSSLSKFAGVTFEEFVREMLSGRLRLLGILPEGAKLRREIIDGEEINLFYDNPLIVGEVTARAESVEEINKLLRKARIAERKFGRKAMLFLIILTARKDVAAEIRKIAKEHDVDLIIGKETKE